MTQDAFERRHNLIALINTYCEGTEGSGVTKQERFFYDNAGHSVAQGETTEQGRERSAKELAAAETWAVQEGYSFVIEPDNDADESFMDHEPEEYQCEWRGKAWVCLMFNESDEVVQSLSGCYGDSKYERVVRAELASEQMSSMIARV